MPKYRGKGWSVEADIAGENRPDPIAREIRVPYLVARKRGAKRIIRVEAQGILESDSRQNEAFGQSVTQQNRTKFIIEEA